MQTFFIATLFCRCRHGYALKKTQIIRGAKAKLQIIQARKRKKSISSHQFYVSIFMFTMNDVNKWNDKLFFYKLTRGIRFLSDSRCQEK